VKGKLHSEKKTFRQRKAEKQNTHKEKGEVQGQKRKKKKESATTAIMRLKAPRK